MSLKDAAIPSPVLEVVRRLEERGFSVYLVGGCVRDLLRGVPPKDFDVATSALPEQVISSFRRVIPTGIDHGTVTVLSAGHPVEVTTFRLEGEYLDGRRPSKVEFHSEIEVDLSRRDFTINAMAYRPGADAPVDPFRGQEDLRARLVRCVGDPHARFSEDGLRPLRAVRFVAVLDFRLDPATETAIGSTLDVFRRVAMERVREEFLKLLLSERVRLGLELLSRTGLLDCFLPELAALPGGIEHAVATVEQLPADPALRLAALLHDLGEERTLKSLERLKLPKKLMETAGLLVRHGNESLLRLSDDASLRRFAAKAGTEHLSEIFSLARSCLAAEHSRLLELENRLRALLLRTPPLSTKQLALDGRQIMAALGTGPSPIVGEASRFLLDQVLENPALNTAETLTELVAKWALRQRS